MVVMVVAMRHGGICGKKGTFVETKLIAYEYLFGS